jgi:hypothetical protein
MGKVQISDQNLGCFVGTGASVVEEQEKKVIAAPLRILEVCRPEQGLNFGLLEIGDGLLSAFLEGYRADLSAPSDILGAVQCHKTGQRVDGCQTLVPSRNRALPAVLKISKELSH